MINLSDKLKNKLNTLPMKPGVYKMIDAKGNIIYVGKSKMLKNRVKATRNGIRSTEW
jgi:excinuclease ABC subunit C